MPKIIIHKTPNADTRSIKVLDKNAVLADTLTHRRDVKNVLDRVANTIIFRGLVHDKTKTEHFDEFFDAIASGKTGDDFKKLDWWKLHLTERHHLNDSVPKDVNLIDVIEMVVDGVCAGKARTGEVFPITLSNELLQTALQNTVKLIMKNTEVK